MSGSEQDWLGFSCPQEELNNRLVTVVTAEHAKTYARKFVERFKAELDQRGDGLSSLIERGAEFNLDFETVWDIAFSNVRLAVLDAAPASVLPLAAALGLRLHRSLIEGSWSLRFNSPTRLRWERWILPPAEQINVTAMRNEISIQVRHGRSRRRLKFRRGNQWSAVGQVEPLQVARINRHQLIILTRTAFSAAGLQPLLPNLSKQSPSLIMCQCKTAISLLRKHAPLYLPWVDKVIRGVVPLRREVSLIRSGSQFDRPGIIEMSLVPEAAAVAEMMVHEASHQYFQIVCRIGEVDDGSDQALYYSPTKGMGRPIRYILLAYHAFANVLLYYRSCIASGIQDGGYCAKNEEALRPQLAHLESALRRTKALTPFGRALWKPLAARIN